MNHLARRTSSIALIALLLTAATSASSLASVVVTGDVSVVAPPLSVEKGADVTPRKAILFQERSAFALPSLIRVDVSAPGTSDGGSNWKPSPSFVPRDTVADIWFLHTDPRNDRSTEYIGTITFDTPILGIIDTQAKLDETDPILGNPGTTYPTGLAARDLEGPDTFTLSADRRTISFDFVTAGAVDEIRILAAIPEPSAYALAGVFGAAGLVGAWLRRSPAA
jgi:hypothetical protein